MDTQFAGEPLLLFSDPSLRCSQVLQLSDLPVLSVFPALQYDFVELLDGSRLIAREQRNLLESERGGRQARSVSVHEAGFIQYLDSGIWHLAFYNDGKNTEQVSFNTIVIGKNSL